MSMIDAGNLAFMSAELITTEQHVEGWPQGANALWKRAAKWAKKNSTCFLWTEPDSIPTSQNWIKSIHDEYLQSKKPFLGHVYRTDKHNLPPKVMSGIGVYPENAIDVLDGCDCEQAWDMAAAEKIVPHCHNSKLIRHFWGLKEIGRAHV